MKIGAPLFQQMLLRRQQQMQPQPQPLPQPQLQPPGIQPNVQNYVANAAHQYLLGQFNLPGPQNALRRRYGMLGTNLGYGADPNMGRRPGIYY